MNLANPRQSHRPQTRVGCPTQECGWLLASATFVEDGNCNLSCHVHGACARSVVSTTSLSGPCDSQSGIFVREMEYASAPDTVGPHVVSIVSVAVLSEIVASVVRLFISCDVWLEGTLGAIDLRSAAVDCTGGGTHFYHGENTAEQIVPVPRVRERGVEVIKVIQEQNVEVIKVILQEQCQQMRSFLLRACGDGAVGSTGRACCPTVSPTRECWCFFERRRWNLELVVLDYSHTSQWVRFCGHLQHTCECSWTRSTL